MVRACMCQKSLNSVLCLCVRKVWSVLCLCVMREKFEVSLSCGFIFLVCCVAYLFVSVLCFCVWFPSASVKMLHDVLFWLLFILKEEKYSGHELVPKQLTWMGLELHWALSWFYMVQGCQLFLSFSLFFLIKLM